MSKCDQVLVHAPIGSNFRGRVVAKRKDHLVWILRNGQIKTKDGVAEFVGLHLCRNKDGCDKIKDVQFIWLIGKDKGRTFPDELAAFEQVKSDEMVVGIYE